MEKWHSLEFTTFISANSDFDPWLNLSCAVVALPVKSALCALSTWVSIVARSGILYDSITVNKLFANRICAVVLKCDNYRVAVILDLLIVFQKGTLAKFEVLFDLLVLLTRGIQEIVVHRAAVFLIMVIDGSE